MGGGSVVRGLVVSVAVLAGLCWVGAAGAGAATEIGGDRDSNGSLVIDPSGDPVDALTRELSLSGSVTVGFVQRMPVTKVVNRVTVGDLGQAASCTSPTRTQLYVREHVGGPELGGDLGDSVQVAYSPSYVALPATPGRVGYDIPATTFREGRGYSFLVVANYSANDCKLARYTTWAHDGQVNGGPSTCVGAPVKKRMWHVNGLDDASSFCVTRPPGSRNFDPSMPTGWLVSQYAGSNWDIMTGRYESGDPVHDACDDGLNTTPRDLGADDVYWRQLADTNPDWVCMWTQFADYGQTVPDGWYYAQPWLVERGGAPRDMYLKLDTIDYDALLAEYVPVLKFDSESEFWNASPQTITDWSENELKFDNQGGDCASFSSFVHGTNDWGIETLVALWDVYPGTQCHTANTDNVDANGDDKAAADSYLDGQLDNKAYGRVVHDSTGALWLQYWLFYYYNTQNVLGFGTHQGDWEMVQYRLDSANVPDVSTYAQHADGGAETCTWDKVEKYPVVEGGVVVRDAPVVYVAAESQASYFVAGDHHRGSGLPDDHADGQGELRSTGLGLVSLAGPPAWAEWLGQWGEDGSSPRSPGQQGTRWDDPKAFNDGAGPCSNPDGSPR